MDSPRQSPNKSSNSDLIRYAGLGTQLFVAIGLSVFIGVKADKWLHTSPLFSCALPLIVLCGIFYKLVRETGKPNKDEPK